MPSANTAIASNTEAIHLLRALLREASYLPDETARNYFTKHIVGRFKAYQPKQNAVAQEPVKKGKNGTLKRRKQELVDVRTRPMLKKAREGLHYLQRANQGQLPALQRTLYHAYGRTGRRKHILLDELLRPDTMIKDEKDKDVNISGSPTLQDVYRSNNRWLQYFDAPKAIPKEKYNIEISRKYGRLRAVLISQRQNNRILNGGLISTSLKTPMLNTWERSMPLKRAVNDVRRWYADTMTRLLPPLPTEEWDNVQAMIEGTKPISFKKRRTPVGSRIEEAVTQEADLLDIINQAVALDKPNQAEKSVGKNRPHTINTRFMRNLYFKLLTLCCKLEHNERGGWTVIWGKENRTIKPDMYSIPEDAKNSLFNDVDSKGRILQADGKAPRTSPREDYLNIDYISLGDDYVKYLPASHPHSQAVAHRRRHGLPRKRQG